MLNIAINVIIKIVQMYFKSIMIFLIIYFINIIICSKLNIYSVVNISPTERNDIQIIHVRTNHWHCTHYRRN